MDKVGKDKEVLIQIVKADIPFVSQSAVTKLITKHNMKGAEINKFKEEFNIESVELDEDIMPLIFGGGIIAGLLPVLYLSAKEIAGPSIGKLVDKLKKNKNYKMSDSEKSDVKGFVSKVKKEKPSLLQKVMKQAKLNLLKDEVELDEAVKVGDTVTVKLNRKGREYIEKGKVTKIEKDSIIVKHDFSRTPSRVSMKNIVKEEVELDEKLDQNDKPTVNNVVKMLNKASKAHAGQATRDADKMTADAKVKVGGAVSGATAGLEKSLALKAQKNIDPADIDTSATDDDIKAADKNIMMQLRKSVSLRGQFPVEFLDKKKVKIPQKIAQAALTKYNSLKKPMDKEKFQSKIAKSHRDLLMALKEDIDEMKMTFGTKRIPAAMKKKGMDKVKTPGMAKDKSAGAYIGKMKKESTLERMNKKLQERQDG